jgi:hypothetical protein
VQELCPQCEGYSRRLLLATVAEDLVLTTCLNQVEKNEAPLSDPRGVN